MLTSIANLALNFRALLLLLFLAPLASGGFPVAAQTAAAGADVASSDGRPYESWTLFLICSPSGLSDEKSLQVKRLYSQFLAFGKAIGDRNLAIWPTVSRKLPKRAEAQQAYDASAADRYCRRYQLSSSAAPHIVATRVHPSEIGTPSDTSIVSLNGLDAAATNDVLDELTDQVRRARFVQTALDSASRWARLNAALRNFSGTVCRVVPKVTAKISIKSIEVGGDINCTAT